MVGLGVDFSIAPLLSHHLDNLDEGDSDIEELFIKFNGPNEVVPYVTSIP